MWGMAFFDVRKMGAAVALEQPVVAAAARSLEKMC
jgi:hypothetical protein